MNLSRRFAGFAGGSLLFAGRSADSLPHCPYPQEAVYDGVGDANTAASYVCTTLD